MQRIDSSKKQNEVRRRSETSGGDVGGRLSHPALEGSFRQLNISQCLRALLKWVKEKIREECVKRERKCLGNVVWLCYSSAAGSGGCLPEISYYRYPGWNDIFVCKLCFQTRLSQSEALSCMLMISMEKSHLVMPCKGKSVSVGFKIVLTILSPRFAAVRIASVE